MDYGLFLDTSIAGVAMAIADLASGSCEPLWMDIRPEKKGSASLMSEVLEQGLRELGITSQNLRYLAVSRGPGSFTGIKAGLAWAYGLAAPMNPEARWLSSSATEAAASYLVAGRKENHEKPLMVLLPSTRTHGYASYWENERCRSFLVSTRDQEEPFAAFKALAQNADLVWAGAWSEMEQALGCQNAGLYLNDEKKVLETGLLGMVREGCLAGSQAYGPSVPEPNYLRKSTAEERLDMLKGTV